MRRFHKLIKSFNNNLILNNTIKTSCKMQTKGDFKNILTHETNEVNLDDIVESIKQRLIQMGYKDGITVQERLNLLKQLTEFEFGRYLLINRGLTGYWTRYINLYQKRKHEYNVTHPLERFLLERAPGIIASQQRFDIFQNLLKENIKDNMKVCSLPCGLMDDLLTLEISNRKNVEFIGIDIDENSVSTAKAYAKSLNLDKMCNFYVMDAWKMDFIKEFDIVTSNMLVQYVSDEDSIMKFYKLVFNSLKNDGIFIISCLLPMSAVDWSKSKYDMKDVKLSAVVFYDIIQAKWTQFILREKMIQQLIETGFKTVETYYDEIKRFPSLLAKK
jgi:ubiquinone/menaquinone biosynthesis C-methylase UbiE